MKPYLFILTTLLFSSFVYSQQMNKTKKEIIESIESHKENIISISDKTVSYTHLRAHETG